VILIARNTRVKNVLNLQMLINLMMASEAETCCHVKTEIKQLLCWTGFDVILIIRYTTRINRFKIKAELMAISQRLAVCQEEIAHLVKTFAHRELNGICILISGHWNILPE